MLFVPLLLLQAVSAETLTCFQSADKSRDRLTQKADITLTPGDPPSNSEGVTISVNRDERYQSIDGFGGAFTDSTAWLFSQLSEEKQEESYFGESGHKYTLARLQIGSSDFALEHYNYANSTDDYALDNFTIAHDEAYIIPMIRRAIEKRTQAADGGSLLFLSTPWSPPAWMKRNNRMQNSLMPGLRQEEEVQAAWALYFSKYISAYKDAGVDVSYVTVQNEPHVAKQFMVTYECCGFDPTHERDFLRDHLGPRLRADHPSVKIYIHDDQKDDRMIDMVDTVMADPAAAQYVDGVAFHWYDNWGKNYDILDQVQTAYPTLPLLATEATLMRPLTQFLPWNHGYWAQGQMYAVDIIRDLNHGATGWIDWNMLLDRQGGPSSQSLGPIKDLGNCDAPIRLNLTGYPFADEESGDGSLIYGSAYWHFGHFSRFLPVGSVRVEVTAQVASDEEPKVEFVCFETPSKELTLIVLNGNDNEETYTFNVPGVGFSEVTMPPQSIQTLVLKE